MMIRSIFNSVKDCSGSFGRFVSSFFRSWYGHVGGLSIMLVSSAFLVTFYTTSLPVLRSLPLEQHVMTFLLNILLMLPLVLAIGMTVYSLDKSMYWKRYKTGRWIFQLVMLCLVLGTVVLHTVRWVYLKLFSMDLFEIGYMERDFVLVMVCILLQQVYYFVYALLKATERLQTEILGLRSELSTSEEKNVELNCANERLKEELTERQADLESQREGCGHCALHLIYAWSILLDMTKEIEVSFDKTSFVNMPVRFLSKVYIEKEDGVKLFYALLVDGRKALLAINALSALESLCPSILMKNKIDELINILSIRGMENREDRPYLDLFGGGQAEVGKSYWERLRVYLDDLENAMQNAKELLKKEWNADGEKGGDPKS
ncbi:hypothetical protein [Sphingobacterium faecale]|uniref:Uncharacterized protein n=1 Tax=Sphingobacterium faecale TaxID=2803775 RepID=A0ABS1R9X4_9SPHI|nr:hypothetical protein [Sphingobacterium faecale]MBL1411496.1 hypothetical protein [Sphingobacterium faecale]